ncbi:MAG: hypothetical protein IT299_01310 [Dehalococcoidia bacterium]|nr:hypothetical protein [Dehalococcoidia bacterium]
MNARPWLIVMLGGMSGGRLEEQLRSALEASALDALEVALATGAYERGLLIADRPPVLEVPPSIEVDVDAPGAPFEFGTRLADAIRERDAAAVVYLGGGSAPLLAGADFEALAAALDTPDPRGVSNNFYSADLFGVRPAAALGQLTPRPTKDNGVPRRLRDECGIEFVELPRSLATQTNLDTPVDLAALALSGRGGPRLRRALADVPVLPRLGEAARLFTDRHAEVLVAGRVSSRAWQYLERETACRVRLLAEERGMSAAGRETDGSARSLLGMLLAEAGSQRFFSELLPDLGGAAFLDIRPALVQLGLHPSRADRFAADLGLASEITDAGLRSLVEAANAAPVPVVLGGHSLVAGGLMLLNDWAWEQRDGVRRAASVPV